jgi:hypothetical protein
MTQLNEQLIDRLCSKEKEILLIAEKVEHITEQVRGHVDLYKDVHTLVIEMRTLKEDVSEIKAELTTINAKPGETLKWLRGVLGGAIITAITGFILKAIGLI